MLQRWNLGIPGCVPNWISVTENHKSNAASISACCMWELWLLARFTTPVFEAGGNFGLCTLELAIAGQTLPIIMLVSHNFWVGTLGWLCWMQPVTLCRIRACTSKQCPDNPIHLPLVLAVAMPTLPMEAAIFFFWSILLPISNFSSVSKPCFLQLSHLSLLYFSPSLTLPCT